MDHLKKVLNALNVFLEFETFKITDWIFVQFGNKKITLMTQVNKI